MSLRGAYGLVFVGLEGADQWLTEAPAGWTPVEVVQQVGEPVAQNRFEADRAEIVLVGGRSVEVTRDPPTVRFVGPSVLGTDEIIHPFIAVPASVLAHWRGAEPFHAGAFVAQEKAWLLIADRDGGKTSTLAALADRGYEVLSDDVSIVADGMVLAGPRMLDLRDETASSVDLGVIGSRRRWRRKLGDAGPARELGGWFHLNWGESENIVALDTAEKIRALSAARAVRRHGVEPRQFLNCVRVPGWRVVRTRAKSSPDQQGERIIRMIQGSA